MHGAAITTRAGDRGATRLACGAAVTKSDPRVEALGSVDELVSGLGLARAAVSPDRAAEILEIQRILFRVGAEVASLPDKTSHGIVADDITRLDALCRRLTDLDVQPPKGFVLPGASPGGAALDWVRTVARKCERRVVACVNADQHPHLLAWVNRLSDVLWLMARVQEEGRSTRLKEDR